MRPTPRLLALALATLAAEPRAFADAASAQAAERLFQEGMALLEKGNPGAACPKLEESFKLDPAIGTQFRWADCLEKQGKLAAAHDVFIEVAEQSKRFGDAGKEATARARATALEPKLARLVVEVPAGAPADLALTVGGAALDRAQWGKERWVDPAPALRVRAQAAGFEPVELDVKAEAGAVARAKVPSLTASKVEPPPKPPEGKDGTGQRVAGIVVGALGLVAVGVGAGLGVSAKSIYDDALASECGGDPKSCSALGRQKGEEAFTQSYASTGLFIGGGVAAAVGLVVLLTAPSGPKKQGNVPWVAPVATPRGGGLVVGGTF